MIYKELWKMKNGTKVIRDYTHVKAIHYEYLDTNKLELNKRYFDQDKVEKISTTVELAITIQVNSSDIGILKINNTPVENYNFFNAVKNYISSTGYVW